MPKAPKAVHPNSRRASALIKRGHREQRMDKNMKERNIKLENQGAKLQWFHDNLDENKKCYDNSEVCELIERYLGRFEEELEQIELANSIKGRKGLQHAAREQHIKVGQQAERKEYESIGYEIPDLTNKKHFKAFSEWTGELKYIPNLVQRRFKPCKVKAPAASKEESADEGISD
ncbi:hypothetical protein CAPTEDRAFT_190723 [Capitella teleta]|uniref:Translation machinery-associated protein 16 n=1 Tax=Capitella teleta TaxID=283909 RepID=R7TYH4_CAPTE|nr:hypothetical protein CAPTEDRAFT_190723 [Capitella teleta]|eukprot:ELT96476.1 hypothetical protein CAPTEDRAFT_190723 [Capitella teleta]